MIVRLAILPLLLLAPAAQATVGTVVETVLAPPPDFAPLRLNVVAEDVPPIADERLNRFRIKLDLINGSPDGVFFSSFGVTGANHTPVFPGITFEDLGSDFDTVFVSASLPPGQGVDVSAARNGLLSFVLEFGPAARPQTAYPVRVDPVNTAFFDVDGGRLVSVTLRDGGIIGVPEPFSLALLAPLALAALARRRRR